MSWRARSSAIAASSGHVVSGDQRSELPLVALMAGVDIDDDLRGAQVKSLVRGIESGLKSEYENVYRVDVVAIGGAQAVTT